MIVNDCTKKMATLHFTTIPCEPNRANRHKENHIFWGNSNYNTVFGTFGVVGTFRGVF